MALWLQATSLLVLLALSPPSTNADTPRHLCGSHLVEALYLVCGNKGFVYNPNQKRDVSPVLGFLPPKAARGEKELAEFAFKDQKEMMVKRGIVDECCNSPCSIFVLQKYCGSLY